MLAYISMHKNGWENHSYVALCSTADRAALQMLKDNPHLKTVYLCLDNDSAGHLGCERVADSIHALGDYKVWRVTPQNKDWDEDLKALNGREAIPSSDHYESEPQTSLAMTM
jgi:DNA primase